MSQLQDFLNILDTTAKTALKVKVSSKKSVDLQPLSFKQQKLLVTAGLNGVTGAITFLKNLNDIIIHNTDDKELKIYDRVPIVLALRKELTDKKITKNDVEISTDELIANYKPFTLEENGHIDGEGYVINLRIPTLEQDNKFMTTCVEDIKKDDENFSKNISLILSYEIPKFIDSIVFGENKLVMDQLTSSERIKIMDNIPANITNKITDFIVKIREYDEELLTVNGVTVDMDSTLFE